MILFFLRSCTIMSADCLAFCTFDREMAKDEIVARLPFTLRFDADVLWAVDM